ncbi:MAG TPA: mevalonate kinase [Nitrososphaerales archaeon]|nr:mevalonate kinase [Nitrososphaerales archaeon]
MKVDGVRASAPGKVIITGEHFVVHGAYAVAAAIDRRATVTVSQSGDGESFIVARGRASRVASDDQLFSAPKAVARRLFSEYGLRSPGLRIEIESTIPAGSGLGSSAAVSVATAAALSRFMRYEADDDRLYEIAMAGEKKIHGSPSGIDIQASLRGGVILFSKNTGAKQIPLSEPIQLLVAHSGKQRKTSDLIRRASFRKDEYPDTLERLTQSASLFSLEAATALSKCNLPYLGAIMNLMQSALCWIGVSNRPLEDMVELALSKDSSYGAKITGAGGGGCIVVLPKPEKAEFLLRQMLNHYSDSFLCKIPQSGVCWESEFERQ